MLKENTLTMQYNRNYWTEKPIPSKEPYPDGKMTLNLTYVFQSSRRRGESKLRYVTETRQFLKVIMQMASDEDLQQLEWWLKRYQPGWVSEFIEMSNKMKRHVPEDLEEIKALYLNR